MDTGTQWPDAGHRWAQFIGDESITVDGTFDAAELRAMADWLEAQ